MEGGLCGVGGGGYWARVWVCVGERVRERIDE